MVNMERAGTGGGTGLLGVFLGVSASPVPLTAPASNASKNIFKVVFTGF